MIKIEILDKIERSFSVVGEVLREKKLYDLKLFYPKDNSKLDRLNFLVSRYNNIDPCALASLEIALINSFDIDDEEVKVFLEQDIPV